MDAVIEIGAARVSGKRVVETWQTLVNPHRPVPPFIVGLTGINDDMLRDAPSIEQVIPQLAQFAGGDPIVGHNIRFDLSFLQPHGILAQNVIVDTYELAAVLMPGSPRYNLGTVGKSLGIAIPNSHRASDDALLSALACESLFDQALALPSWLLEEIIELGEGLDWHANWFFREALSERTQRFPSEAESAAPDLLRLFPQARYGFRPLNPSTNPAPLDLDEVEALLEDGGPFARHFDHYEHRAEQVEMLRAVARAFSTERHLLVEAGTGVGKSFAYLIPAALWAVQNGQRVVISTNTIALQDQLIHKDLPDLSRALGLSIQATLLKGRANYLCPRRLKGFLDSGPSTPAEARVGAKMLVWLTRGGSGDRGEINLNGPEEAEIWRRLSAEDEGCTNETCINREGGVCPFLQARQSAQAAHIIVVNHALLLTDVLLGNRVLPEYDYLVVDEAHQLEPASTSAMTLTITQADMARLLRELGGPSAGLLGRLLTGLHGGLRPGELAAVQQFVDRIADTAFRLDVVLNRFFKAVEHFLEDEREGNAVGQYAQQVRVTSGVRHVPQWEPIETGWEEVHEPLKGLLTLLLGLQRQIHQVYEVLPEWLEDLSGDLGDVLQRLTEIEAGLDAFITSTDDNRICWIENSSGYRPLSFKIAPLAVGPLLEQYLWHEKKSMVLTSATLTAAGSFDYLRTRLNADEAEELALGSPFDYENAALLYLVNDIPEPNGPGYQHAVEQTILRLSQATQGRLMALFTSYSQLRTTAQAIAPALAQEGIFLFEQGEGASASTLLDSFRTAEKAVLFGTGAFWEGVDIPGEALSVLVIVRLPFDVPSDPIVAARSETFDSPFDEYSLPEAILRFRQGFGRLIRSQSDRGVVAILDRRILTKRYGKQFLKSLPACTVRPGSMRELPAAAAKWLE
jgi:DNA polymerase-3 subunit epsilon/ATP-dependent DNA helicase DinG